VTALVTGTATPAVAATTVLPVSLYVTTTAETASADQATVEQKVRDEFQGMSDYWFSMSNGLVRFEIKQLVYRPGEGVCKNGNPRIRDDAQAATGWGGGGSGESLIIAVAEGCTYAGSATNSGTFLGGGRAYLEGLWDGNWAHEMGHTLTFGHANLLDCPAGVVDGRIASEGGQCTSRGYGDAYDVMGVSYQTVYKNFSTPNQIRVGILTAEDYVDIDSPTAVDQTVVLQAREATSGTRSLEFTDPSTGITYWAELATPVRYDNGYGAGSINSVVGGGTYQYTRGVRILRMLDTTQTLLISPAATTPGTRQTSWPVGSTFETDGGAVNLEVVAQTATTATLRLRTTVADTTAPEAPVVTTITADRLTGTAEPGATITVADAAGATVGSVIVDENGNYDVPVAPVQAVGAQLVVTATDAVGNASPATDVTVPAPTPSAPTVDPTTGAVVSGTSEPDAVITVNKDGATLGTTTATADGSFTLALPTAQPVGTVLQVTATTAGGTSPTTFITVTAPAPAAPVVEPTDGSTVSGTAAAGAGIAVKAGGTLVGSGIADSTGRFTVQLDPAQAPGTDLEVTAAVGEANVSAPTTVTVQAAPVAPTVQVASGSIQAGTTQTFTGSGFAPGETVRASITPNGADLGTQIAGADGSVSFTWAAPADIVAGTYTVTLTGEESGEAQTQFLVTAAAGVAPQNPVTPGAGNPVPAGSGSGDDTTPTSHGTLAFTGSDLTALSLVSGIPVVAGALLLLGLWFRRRRSATETAD